MISDKLAAITLLDDLAALADIADAADKAGRTALADLIDAELEVRAAEPLETAPTPALSEMSTEVGPEESGMSPYFGREAPVGRVPTMEDVMKALSTQAPLDPAELRGMSQKDLELLRTRLGLALNMVEKAMGAEPTFLLNPEEQEKHEEVETLRGTIGAMKSLMTKRGDLSSAPIPNEEQRKEVHDVAAQLSPTVQVVFTIAHELAQEGNRFAVPLQKVYDILDDSVVRLLDVSMPFDFQVGAAASPPLSKRGGPWDFTPEAAIEHLKKLEKEKGEDTYLSKYPFPEKPSGAAAALEPLHRMVVETFPRIQEMAKNVGWKLLNNLPEDRAELERLGSAAFSLSSEMADTGDEYVRAVADVAQRTASQMKQAEEEKADREKWAELEPMGRRLLEELEPFSKGEEWHQEPARTIKLLRNNLDEGFRPRLIHQTEGYIERAQQVLQRLKAGEKAGFSYE